MPVKKKNSILFFSGIGVLLLVVICAVAYLRYDDKTQERVKGANAAPADATAQTQPIPPAGQTPSPTKASPPKQAEQQQASSAPPRPRRKMDVDLAQLAASYDDLKRKAEAGDSEAAMALFEGLSLCRGTPLTQAALDDAKGQLATQFGVNSQ